MMADGENFEDWCAFVCEEVCRAAPKKGIVQRFLHHSCQQFAQTVNVSHFGDVGCSGVAALAEAAGTFFGRPATAKSVRFGTCCARSRVRAADGLLRSGTPDCQWGLEAKPETVLNLQAVTHQDHQGAGYIELGL